MSWRGDEVFAREKKAALLLEQRNIANEQKDIDTEEDESGSEGEEEKEEEEGKEKTTSGKRVKTKKSGRWQTPTNLQASMEDVNKACEEKIKRELEAASAQVLKSKRELETIELKLGVVEVERDAANKSKKNLQIELEKALARESRVLTCLDSLEMEVTGFAEACRDWRFRFARGDRIKVAELDVASGVLRRRGRFARGRRRRGRRGTTTTATTTTTWKTKRISADTR